MESRGGPILAFKRLTTAAITIAWIELLRRIRKRQFHLSPRSLRDRRVCYLGATLAAQ